MYNINIWKGIEYDYIYYTPLGFILYYIIYIVRGEKV